MQPSSKRHSIVSPPFKMLVAHLESSSDPSKGEAGIPKPIRQGFTLQQVTSSRGIGTLGTASDAYTTLAIRVNSTEYGNPLVAQAPPYYDRDFIQIYSQGLTDNSGNPRLIAGDHFGRGEGHGLGNSSDVASSLVTALNTYGLGLKAKIDPQDNTRVLISSLAISDTLVVNIKSVAFNLFTGNPPFVVEEVDGTVLFNPAVENRSTCRIMKRPDAVGAIQEF